MNDTTYFDDEQYSIGNYDYMEIVSNVKAHLLYDDSVTYSIERFRNALNLSVVNMAGFYQKLVGDKKKNKTTYQKLSILLGSIPAVPYLYFISLIICHKESTPHFPILINDKFKEAFTHEDSHDLTVFASLLHYSLLFNQDNFRFLARNFSEETIKVFFNKDNIKNNHFVRFFSDKQLPVVISTLSDIGLTKVQINSFIDLLSLNTQIRAASLIEKKLLNEAISEEVALQKHGKIFKV